VRHETLRFGQSWARLAPWRGHLDIAQLVIGPDAYATPEAVHECLERARIAGYRSIVTGAVTGDDSAPFLEAGLAVHEHLHLLARDLAAEPATPGRGTARATFLDRKAIVDLDNAAFEPFWRLGAAGIRDALDATPKSRMRVGHGDPRVSAYAITGRAGEYGYLQRVAVHPDARRRGWGRALVADALLWLWEHGTARAYVNTQLENQAALDLYEASGFTLMPEGLLVLGGPL
jgi:ribosomal protein S18 acetylase RimI-like enzyme